MKLAIGMLAMVTKFEPLDKLIDKLRISIEKYQKVPSYPEDVKKKAFHDLHFCMLQVMLKHGGQDPFSLMRFMDDMDDGLDAVKTQRAATKNP